MILQDLPNEVIEALDVLDLRQLLGLRFVVQIDGVGFRGKETVFQEKNPHLFALE